MIKLIADCHLGKVAKYLRLFGFDTLFFESISDSEIIRLAHDENRKVLTRDRELCRRLGDSCHYVSPLKFEEQLTSTFDGLNLWIQADPFIRCLSCNGLLESVEKEVILHKLEPKTIEFYDRFAICKTCGKVYWEGDHHQKMDGFVHEFLTQQKKHVSLQTLKELLMEKPPSSCHLNKGNATLVFESTQYSIPESALRKILFDLSRDPDMRFKNHDIYKDLFAKISSREETS